MNIPSYKIMIIVKKTRRKKRREKKESILGQAVLIIWH